MRSAIAWPRIPWLDGPPIITATPPIATIMAIHVRRLTRSPRATPARIAAATGASAWRKRTFATVVSFSATMKLPEATAVMSAKTSPARPIERNAPHDVAATGDRHVDEEREQREESTTGHLGRRVQRELALEQPGRRPRDRREDDVGLSATSLPAELARVCRRGRHRA